MTNEQLYLSLCGPILAVALNFGFFALIWLRISHLEERMTHRFDIIESDLKSFYKVLGDQGTDVARLKDKTGLK